MADVEKPAPTFVEFLSGPLKVKLTPAQRVLCLVSFDDVEPADLDDADKLLALELFGDWDTAPPAARHTVAWTKGARIGGTWLCSLYLLYRALTADLSKLAPGEVAYAPAVSPDLKTSRQITNYIRGAAKSVPAIAKLITSETREGIVIRRLAGRSVSLETLAATRGGSALRGRSMVAGLMDESSFFFDADSGVVNDAEVSRAMAPRIIPGGKLAIISTAWSETGLLWDLTAKNWGSPTTAIAAVARTLTVRTDSPQLAVIVAEERERDPQNAAREFDCKPFGQGASAFFDSHAIDMAIDRDAPVVQLPRPTYCAVMGMDTGFRKDPSAGVIVRWHADTQVLEVAEILEIVPPAKGHLVPSEVLAQLAEMAKRHGCTKVVTDQHYLETVREHSDGLNLVAAPGGLNGKIEAHTRARTALHEGRVRIPAGHTRLLQQLREIVSRPTSGGNVTISSPRRAGRHGDIASAFVLALWGATVRTSGCGPIESYWL